MNTKPAPENDEPLSAALREWKVDHHALPPRFAEQVWHRIALSERSPEPWWKTVLQSLQTPKVAYAYVAVLVALGIAAGSWSAHVASDRTADLLSQRYVEAVDPYSMPGR